MINYSGKLQQLLCLITCVLMVVAVSIRRDGKVAGRELKQQQKASPKTETMVVLEDGSVRLNTTELGKDIIGYGGTVPFGNHLAGRQGEEYQGPRQLRESRILWGGFSTSFQMGWTDHRRRAENESGRGDWCDILLQGYHRKRTARTSVCGKESR